jgi:hypothetical protein
MRRETGQETFAALLSFVFDEATAHMNIKPSYNQTVPRRERPMYDNRPNTT